MIGQRALSFSQLVHQVVGALATFIINAKFYLNLVAEDIQVRNQEDFRGLRLSVMADCVRPVGGRG